MIDLLRRLLSLLIAVRVKSHRNAAGLLHSEAIIHVLPSSL